MTDKLDLGFVLANARKVPRDYFKSSLLLQAGDPGGWTSRSREEGTGLMKTTTLGGEEVPTGGMLRARGYVVFPMNDDGRGQRRMLVAVGPEGGWEEPY